jgi:hypothetical protein
MFEEHLLLPGGEILEARVSADLNYVLSVRRGDAVLVEYSSAGRREFKSVEKLRYDFQRDAEDALRQG